MNQPVLFSSAESIDPDGGPLPLEFRWEFGDGSTSTEPNPAHAYAAARAYRVSLTVSDGRDAAIDTIVVHVLAPPTPLRPTGSSLLALNSLETELWVVNPDANSISVLSVGSNTVVKVSGIAVGKHPRTLALSRDGRRVFVPCQEANELWVLDAARRTVEGRIPVGHQPYGVAVSPSDGTILVSNQGDGTVAVISPGLVVKRILKVGGSPRALAIAADGRFAYVTHFLTRGATGTVTEIDLATLNSTRAIPLVEDNSPDTTSSGGGFPNLLSALAIDPAGQAVWFGGLKANTGRGLFLSGEMPQPESTVRGFFGKVNLASPTEEPDRRIDANDTDSVSAIAFSPNGRWAYAAAVVRWLSNRCKLRPNPSGDLGRPGRPQHQPDDLRF